LLGHAAATRRGAAAQPRCTWGNAGLGVLQLPRMSAAVADASAFTFTQAPPPHAARCSFTVEASMVRSARLTLLARRGDCALSARGR